MEVVSVCVVKNEKSSNDVHEGCILLAGLVPCRKKYAVRTHRGRVLSHVSSSVSLQESPWLLCWCLSSWELLVEGNYFLHADCILSSTETLQQPMSANSVRTIA